MLVGRGALTFRTYRVTGKNATPSAESVAEKLGQFKFTGLGSADEGSATGWVAPEHLFDGDFDAVKMGRGHYLTFALRIDTRRVPGPILAAHIALEEKAWKDANGNARSAEGGTSGEVKIPGAKRREIKKQIKAKLLEETPPTQRAFGVFWRVKSKKLFFQSTSKNANNELVELFARTFDLGLEAQLPGLVAHEVAEENGRLSALGDASPLKLTETPVAVEA